MKSTFTKIIAKAKINSFVLFLLLLIISISSQAHTVTGYTASCNAGPNYSVDAVVTNVNLGSNYAWQYKNSSNAWVCITNGSNTINGTTYNISGATSTATLDPAPIFFNNPSSTLQGLVIRCVISDGTGVNPCNTPINNTWNSDAASVNHSIAISGTPCGTVLSCTCPGNVVLNPSFENGTTSWSSSGGTLSAGTGAIVCGSFSGDFQISNSASNWVSQNIGTDLAAGTIVNASVYAGTHDNTVHHYVNISFFDANWNYLAASSVTVTVNKILGNAPVGPQLYNMTATVPANAKYTQIGYGGVSGWIKTDNWCVTYTAPASNGSIGDRVWGDANGNGIQDAGETNGFTGVTVQLKNAAGVVIATTSTNATGNYLFTGLAAGNYTVVFPISLSGATVTSQNVGADDNIDSDADQTTGATGIITLGQGQNITNVDAGYCPTTLQLGNRVWNDLNNDGLNGGEAGIAGVTVNLYKDNDNNNVADGGIIATTTTDANGYYLFSGLVPGNYIVGVVTPTGYASSSVNGGDPDNDINLDDNGQITVGNETRGLAITLAGGTEPDGTNTNTDTNITYDFGFYAVPLGSIGDRVWGDANGNGIQDASETTGFTGVTVQLKNATGTVIATTTTNATGNYLFTGLAAGNYTVVFPLTLSGATVTIANAGADDNLDSDASQTTGETGIISLASGQNITNVDAGYCPTTLALGDRVYYDLNNNGIRETATEAGIPNVVVNLYKDNNNDNIPDGAAIATTTTDAIGGYRFDNLVPGNYIVGVTPPAGYSSSTNAAIDPDNDVDLDDNGTNLVGTEWRGLAITLTGGAEPLETGNFNHTYDFGFYPTATIGDFVWNDLNGNGIQDAGEPGISGATVNLLNAAGTVIATTTTNGSGIYSFTNVVPGTYSVTFATPVGYIATPSNVGTNDATDSDPISGTVAGIVVGAGQSNTTIDAGFYQPAALGNFVWNDTNANGIQDAGEPGISGVTVNLLNATGTVIATTTTSATGAYSFTNLAPGTYGVSFVTPVGYNVTPSNVGANDAVDSDPVGGAVTGIVLTSGQTNNTIDAGFFQPGSIGNFVWNDTNGNGVQDAGEAGIPGVTVNLVNAAGTIIATTTTDANGNYVFTNVTPGTYSVTFTTPGGYTPTGADLGGNDNTDSDPIGGTASGVVVTAGTANNTVDAGFFQAVNVGNVVWYDQNNNGTKDAGETGISAATVKLYLDANNDNIADGAAIATTTTDANGNYNFGGLTPGNYIVGVNIPTGYAAVTTTGGDPDNNIDNDNNGTNVSVAGEVRSSAVTLVSGTEPTTDGDGNNGNLTVDFGFKGTASIGDFVFNDLNGNGVQDAGEAGIPNVTVSLLNPNGTTTTTTTDANGNYNFTNLAPGSYNVTFTTPAGLTASPSNQGANDAVDSDPIGGTVTGVVLTAGQVNNTVDAGFFTANVMNLGNVVWYDQNNNGTKDAGETGISGATVKLYLDANNDNLADGAAIATTTTDANGVYNFGGLTPNNYIVGVNIPTGYAAVTTTGGDPDNNTDNDNNGTNLTVTGEVRSSAVTLALTTEPTTDGDGNNGNLTVDFAFKGTASLGDFVFNDLNGNGIQDAGELGIPNVTVSLLNPNGTTTTTTTDANGNYNFTNLAPGTYSVTFTTPAGLTASPANLGTNDATDSDPVGGVVSGVVLAAGEINNSVDAGFYAANVMNLGNVVWYDQNNNGTKDAGETGISGAVVKLYLDANNDNVADGAAIASTTTDANGVYNFGGLTPNNYIVGVNIPTGYAAVTTTGGDPDNNTDNDNNGTNTSVAGEVRSSAITLALTTEPTTDGDGNNGNLTVDFAFKGTASIGDFVFNDLNGNGVQDAGEAGIPNVTVSLLNPNGTTTNTTTDANGNYNFPNLAPGTYSVTFTTPSGLTASPANQGANDAVDSDPIAGTVAGIVLTAGQVNNTVDAGFFAANVMNLGNVVWYDQNNNGIKDAGETGISGAIVKLYLDANNDNVADGAAIANTTTDANGVYNFGGLAAGNYIVGVNIPTGYAVVTTNGSDPDNNIDNDNNGTNTSVAGEVRSSAVTLALTTEPTTDGDGNNGNLTVDFAFKGTASIGNYVFNDVNANGIQDVTETGIVGATVILANPNGTTTTTTTDTNGNYNFTNLAPGTYSVTFTTPVGYNVSPSNVTVPGATDLNDSDPVGGIVTGIVLTSGQVNETIDAGFYNCVPLNSAINGPTQICAGEAAVFNATGAGSGSVYTWTFMSGTPATATGINVSSTWSVPGEYDINLTVTKNGCTSSYLRSIVITQSVFANAGPDADICSGSSTTLNGSGPLNSTYSWIVIAGDPTSIDNGANASSVLVSPLVTTTFQLTVSQNGCTRVDQVTVFINVNKNPVADAGPNRTTLIGTPVVIGGSPTGTPPLATPGVGLGYTWTAVAGLNSPTIANPTATLTTAGTVTYRVIVYSLLTSCSDTAFVNVTAIQPVNVGNNVWYDKNNNGIKDAGETAIVTTVNLYKDDNTDNVPDGAAIATTTSTGGVYNFGNLYPGNYIVGAMIPNGYAPAATTANSANPDSDADNDNNGTVTTVPTELRSNTITLTAGGEPLAGVDGDGNNGNLTVDFGFKGTAALGNFVWYDTNRNGIQDASEIGIPGVAVTLTYPDGTTLLTTTSVSGAYSFMNLAPGSYNVNFATPSGLIATVSNSTAAGANDNNDSDPIAGVVNGIALAAGVINNTVDAGFHNTCSNTLKGNIWHDVDELLDNQVDSVGAYLAAAIPGGLTVNLVNTATGKVVRFTTVAANGTYQFANIPPGTYTAVLTLDPGVIGQNAPNSSLPTGWINVGEHIGTSPGSDPATDGRIVLGSSFECVININFGIKLVNEDGGID
jgi:protocatechuate 3,4-dioxygenase beta subunit